MHRSLKHRTANALAGLILALATTANSSFILVENYEDLALGDVDSQGGWNVRSGTAEVQVDPSDSSNQVLAVTTDSARVHRHTRIVQGTVRMMFLRFRISAQQNYSLGMSPAFLPDEFSDFSAEIGMSNANFDLRCWNGDMQYDVLTTLQPETWYNMWILLNTDLNTYRIWLNATPGASADPSGDRLVTTGGDDLFEFRASTNRDLRSFFIKTGGGNSSINSGPLLIDDLFIENRATVNLSNPMTHPGPELTGLTYTQESGEMVVTWTSSDQRSYRITASMNLDDGFPETLKAGVAGTPASDKTTTTLDLSGRTETALFIRVEEE